MSVSTFEDVTRGKKPEKRLLVSMKTDAGRNAQGKITVRHQGGGHRKLYRIIDFKRNKLNIPATVSAIEYDPNRSARIALLTYADGEKRYILSPGVRARPMIPLDHPQGGGEGRSGAGGNPQTPWGKPALGYRTRRNKKTRNMIVRRRPPKRKSKG